MWISNSLEEWGIWVGSGRNYNESAYRHHEKSLVVESILEKLKGETNELQSVCGV